MTTDLAWTLLTGVVIVAILFVLVRPGSTAAQAVTDVGSAMASLLMTATAA